MRFGLMDCNNFFVSCERLFRPDLIGKPVAVLSSNDGCIVARSEEVKQLGVPMGAPYFQVKDLCQKEGVTLFSGNLTLYRDISRRVMATLAAEVGKIEVYSIDEAFFSVSQSLTEADIRAIRERIWREIGIPVSIGVAATKTLAKYASKLGKKGTGVSVLTADDWQARHAHVPCADIWNIGSRTARALRDMDIVTVADLLATPRPVIQERFGVHGARVYDELRGLPVYSLHDNQVAVRQSIMSTRSLATTTHALSTLEAAIAGHVEHIATKLRERQLVTTTLLIQLGTSRHGDFFLQGSSVAVSLDQPTNVTTTLLQAALATVRRHWQPQVPYKRTGVVAIELVPATCRTLTLFDQVCDQTTAVQTVLDTLVDTLNARTNGARLTYAITAQATVKTNASRRSPHYTTLWKDIPNVHAQ